MYALRGKEDRLLIYVGYVVVEGVRDQYLVAEPLSLAFGPLLRVLPLKY